MATALVSPTSPQVSSRRGSAFSIDSRKSSLDQALSRYLRKSGKKQKEFLVQSPYTDAAHLLELSTLDIQDQLFAKALTLFDTERADYATAPYVETFNIAEVVGRLKQLASVVGHQWKEQAFYVVVFRSQIPQTTDYAHLGDLDREAHYEAMRSGGFLKYWYGDPDNNGRNLATCIWRKPEDAKRGSVGPGHRRAAGATRQFYKEWRIERLRLTVVDDAKSWSITNWDDAP